MGLRAQVLSRWVRELAAGVDAGNAIRLGLPVRGHVLRGGNVRAGNRRGGNTQDDTVPDAVVRGA